MAAFNRYQQMNDGGKIALVPFIEIPKRDSDYYEYYSRSKSRLDIMSYQYYGDPNYDWVILQANPQLDGLEFNIPDQTLLRIPYPLDDVLMDYNERVNTYKNIEGLEFDL